MINKPPLLQEYCLYCNYLAPKGREKLCFLGEQLSHRHLSFYDRLIGVIGGAGSGKSSLIRGMFPGLELSNDDDGLSPRKIMQIRDFTQDVFTHATTFHIDMRFQTAFTQMHEIVAFVNAALENNKRVIVEHFDLLYPALKRNADIIMGIGDEILCVRPNVFGPLPGNIYEIVSKSLKRRKAAHTLEHMAIYLLENEFGMHPDKFYSSDITGGFVLKFFERPAIDVARLEARLREIAAQNAPVSYVDESHLKIGDITLHCNGPRIHVGNTSEIGPFTLAKQLVFDHKTNTYCLLGLLGGQGEDLASLNKIRTLG